MSEIEDTMAFQLRVNDIQFEREYRAVPKRRYRWDFRIGKSLLIEVQGGR